MITSRYRTALLKRHADDPDTGAPTITRCALCDWVFVSTAADGRAAFLKHAKRHARRSA